MLAHNSSKIKFHVGPQVLAGQGGEELREWDPSRINHFCSDRSHKNPSKVGSWKRERRKMKFA